jgi:hypothetical protein
MVHSCYWKLNYYTLVSLLLPYSAFILEGLTILCLLTFAVGTLLCEAYESSVKMAKSAEYLDIGTSQLVYKMAQNKETPIANDGSPNEAAGENAPAPSPADNSTNFVDIYNVPPPPMVVTPEHGRTDILYTIVPGQISSAAERRGVNPRIIYGDPGLYSSDLEPEEEWVLEKSYYYKPFDEDSSDDSSGDSSDDEGGTQMSSSKHLHWVEFF